MAEEGGDAPLDEPGRVGDAPREDLGPADVGPFGGTGGLEEVVTSLRRWVLGLGLLVWILLLGLGQPRPVVAGYCVGWLLSLLSLDHIAANARAIAAGAVDPEAAKRRGSRAVVQRWLVMIGAIVVAGKLGAEPLAAVCALLLLQAAIMCRSITSLFTGRGARDERPESGEGRVD